MLRSEIPQFGAHVIVKKIMTAERTEYAAPAASYSCNRKRDQSRERGAQFALTQTGAQLLFGLYWLITGVHVIYLTIGILVIRLAPAGAARKSHQISTQREP